MNNELTVVHANSLVEASYALSMNEMRLIALACTKFNSKNDTADSVGEIRIDVSDFINTYSIDNKNIYAELRDAVRSIMRKPVKMYNEKTEMFEEYAWLTKNAYSKTDGSHVIMKFSSDIAPYLFELKERFTKIDFKYSAKLNTPFSFRLYQWLKKYENLNKNRNNEIVCVELDIEWMKLQSQMVGSYERWGDFKDKVIQPSVDKINAETDLSVIWKPVKTGRKVSSVQFNYVVEVASVKKPLRPRLVRRPKVIKGSHQEGVWMRRNLSLLLDYEKALKAHDPSAKMTLPDLRKMADYASICDQVLEDRLRKEIRHRSS